MGKAFNLLPFSVVFPGLSPLFLHGLKDLETNAGRKCLLPFEAQTSFDRFFSIALSLAHSTAHCCLPWTLLKPSVRVCNNLLDTAPGGTFSGLFHISRQQHLRWRHSSYKRWILSHSVHNTSLYYFFFLTSSYSFSFSFVDFSSPARVLG